MPFVKAIATAAALSAVGLQLAACASSSDKIGAAYVSPVQFQGYNCAQLGEEGRRISGRVAQLSGAQDQKASNDAIVTGVAIVLFWPAAFMIGGNDQTTAELSRLKGEFEAVENASVQKSCGHQFRQQAALAADEKPVRSNRGRADEQSRQALVSEPSKAV